MYIYSLLTNVYHLHLLPLAGSRFHLKSRGRIENQRRDRPPGLIAGLVRHKRNSSLLELDSFLITATLQPPPPLLPPPLPHSLSLSPRPFVPPDVPVATHHFARICAQKPTPPHQPNRLHLPPTCHSNSMHFRFSQSYKLVNLLQLQ